MNNILDLANMSTYNNDSSICFQNMEIENSTIDSYSLVTRHLRGFYNKEVSIIILKNVKFTNCKASEDHFYIGDRVVFENVEFKDFNCKELTFHCKNSFSNCKISGKKLKKLHISYLGGVEKVKHRNSTAIEIDISEHLGEVDIYNLDLNRVVTNIDTQFKLKYQDFENFDFQKNGIERRGKIGYSIRRLQKGRIETLITNFPKKKDKFYDQFQTEFLVLKELGIVS
jgi:ribosomal protein L14E/L6E/L27E